VNSGGPAKGRVLVIEDDRDIALGIRTLLTRSGFEVTSSRDGKEGLRVFHAARPDLVVLDIGLPTLDGWGVLERIRDLSDVPVLMLTAHGREADKVRGLHSGADDYLTKPFGIDEFTARVEALVRRGSRAAEGASELFVDGDLSIDFGHRAVTMHGSDVAVTPIEFRLLAALVRHAGEVVSTDQLLRLAWDDGSGIGADRVKFSVHRLRRKLGWEDLDHSPIESVRGFGYRYRRLSAG
jgi:DNA-binding response OmpR family regulator